jgi:putative DNA primase/helicase
MRFEEFAAGHGLVIDRVEYGAWKRVRTVDHMAKKNGAYIHKGNVAHVQNWATMDEPATWFPDADIDIKIDHGYIARRSAEVARALAAGRQKSANKAGWMLRQCTLEKHAYLDGKGFPDERGNVMQQDSGGPLLLIPMRVAGKLVGLQTITTDGEKKFLFGQQTTGAEYVIDNKGRDWFVEGYATGLSLRAALAALKIRYRVHVCFSARNLTKLASACPRGIVVADNDASGTGKAAAEKSGLPYFLPPDVGQDFNDLHRGVGVFRASQMLRRFLVGEDGSK